MPDQFVFADLNSVDPSTQYTSNTITISGTSLPVSITGGTYSKNGSAFTSAPGTAVIGDTFQVRQTSSPNSATATITTLTIGGVSEVFAATTADAPGNLIQPTDWPGFLAAWAAAAPGDVLDISHAGYSPTTPQVFTLNRSFAAPGVTIIGNVLQNMVIRGSGQANCRVEFVGGYSSADEYYGNSSTNGYNYCDVDLNDCSMVAFQGWIFSLSEWGIMCRGGSGCSDIYINNNVFCFARSDAIRALNGGASNRITITNNYIADLCHQEKFWYKTNNTTPIVSSQYQDGYIQAPEPDHGDAIQAYGGSPPTGTIYDLLIQNNTIKANGGQGVFLTDGFQVRLAALDNTILTSIQNNLRADSATDAEFSRNTLAFLANKDPEVAQISLTLNRPGGVGNAKGGLNVYDIDTTVIFSDTGINFKGPISGTATAPVISAFTGTPFTVGGLPSKRSRPAYTDFSGTPVMVNPPTIMFDNVTSQPYPAGSYLKSYPGVIKGFLYGFQTTIWTRWKVNGSIVQAAAQGTAAMVYQANTAGSVTVEQSFDNINWYASTAVSVVSPYNSWTTGVSNVNYTNNNRTVSKITANALVTLVTTTARSLTTDAKLAWEVTPTQVSGGDISFGFTDGTNTLGFNGSNWYFNGSFVQSGYPAEVKNGTAKFTIYLQISGSGTVRKLWIKGSIAGWLGPGADPNSGGTGFDISSIGFSGPIKAFVTLQNVGDTAVANFGQSAFATLPAGTVGF